MKQCALLRTVHGSAAAPQSATPKVTMALKCNSRATDTQSEFIGVERSGAARRQARMTGYP